MRIRIGNQGRRPIFVGEAEPGISEIEPQLLLLLERLVALLLTLGVDAEAALAQALVAHPADRALVLDAVARGRRIAMARDEPERIQCDGLVTAIGDLVLDGEQVLVVDRDGAA